MLTGEQLKIVRKIAGFTGTEVAERMLVTKQTISSIETGKTETPSSIRYYEMSLKEMVNDLVDPDLHRICLDLLQTFNAENEHDSKWLVVSRKPGSVVFTINAEYKTLAEAERIAYELKKAWPAKKYRVLKDSDSIIKFS